MNQPGDPGADIPGYSSLIRALGWPDQASWWQHWQRRNGLALAREAWPAGIEAPWICGLAWPLFSLLEQAAVSGSRPLIGLSALPGCGKTTLGAWITAAAAVLALPIAVVSLDDFYWPSAAMEARMRGNPWQAPRALPGSHDLELLQRCLNQWQQGGRLRLPQFDKALRGGLGDRAGWRQLQAEVLLLEGWFIGVDPWTPEQAQDVSAIRAVSSLEPTAAELAYRPTIQAALAHYRPLWERMACIWQLQAPGTGATVPWKQQQEGQLQRGRGVAMAPAQLAAFSRMLQLAILPTALQTIGRASTVVRIDAARQIVAIEQRPGAYTSSGWRGSPLNGPSRSELIQPP